MSSSSSSSSTHVVAIATRIHLGNASTPPTDAKLDSILSSLQSLSVSLSTLTSSSSTLTIKIGIAIDPQNKIDGYDLLHSIHQSRQRVISKTKNSETVGVEMEIIPVMPWEKFIPALNALTSWSSRVGASRLVLLSTEIGLEDGGVLKRFLEMMLGDEETLVVGAVLPGHDYRGNGSGGGNEEVMVALNGRTVPWNTLAVWNVKLLGLTGFPLVGDGLHPYPDGSEGAAGVEETSTVALLQRVLTPEKAKAKLVKISSGIEWDRDWKGDEERRLWHERKMESKLKRGKRHLDLLGLDGWVIHC